MPGPGLPRSLTPQRRRPPPPGRDMQPSGECNGVAERYMETPTSSRPMHQPPEPDLPPSQNAFEFFGDQNAN